MSSYDLISEDEMPYMLRYYNNDGTIDVAKTFEHINKYNSIVYKQNLTNLLDNQILLD